jgi:hypothetical protein
MFVIIQFTVAGQLRLDGSNDKLRRLCDACCLDNPEIKRRKTLRRKIFRAQDVVISYGQHGEVISF